MAKLVKDHTGRMFPSVTEMCEAWKVPVVTYHQRLRRGCTVRQALTGEGIAPPRGRREESCGPAVDHLGNVFSSTIEMCEHYRVPYSVFKGRRRLKWNIEDALTKPAPKKKKNGRKTKQTIERKKYYVDYEGKRYKTVKAMCEAHAVPYSTYKTRLSAGWTREEALKGKK